MKKITILFFVLGLCTLGVSAQTEKGIDSQTKKIRNEGGKVIVGNDVSRSWSWGKGKTKIRRRLPNPYKLTSRRDILVKTVVRLLKDNKMIVDETASRFKRGLIVTQPFLFSRGAILTKNELNRYAVLREGNSVWTRGRYTLTIDIQSIDGIRNNVSVIAKVEGRSRDGLFSEWLTLDSSGTAEDEFLAKLVENVGGGLPSNERRP